MAVLYMLGGEVGWRLDHADERINSVPVGAQFALRFDHERPANRARLEHVKRHTGRYTLAAGPTLLLDGVPVPGFPAAPGPAHQLFEAWRDLVDRARGGTVVPPDLSTVVLVLDRLLKEIRK